MRSTLLLTSELWRADGPFYDAPSDHYMWNTASDMPVTPCCLHDHQFRGKSCNTVSNTPDQYRPADTCFIWSTYADSVVQNDSSQYLNLKVQISETPRTTTSSQIKHILISSRKSTTMLRKPRMYLVLLLVFPRPSQHLLSTPSSASWSQFEMGSYQMDSSALIRLANHHRLELLLRTSFRRPSLPILQHLRLSQFHHQSYHR